MTVGYFIDRFDPITNKHIEYAKKLIKDNQLSALYFVVEGNGKADCLHRLNMISRAIHPYRKFKAFKDAFSINEQDVIYRDNTLETASKQVREGDFSLLCYANKKYVMGNGLYCELIIKNLLYEKRFLHSVSVAELSRDIASANGLDSDKAYLIGIYHDIVKKMGKDEMLSLISIYKPYEFNQAVAVWHQYLGAYILKRKFKMMDKESLKAIRHHCLGDDNAKYSKIIFIADKLDPSRGYDSSKEIALALKSIDTAFQVVKKQNEEYLRKTGAIE